MKEKNYRKKLYSVYQEQHERIDSYSKQHLSKFFEGFSQRYSQIEFPPTEKAILDLGCGRGEFLEWLSSKGHINLTGVDISPSSIGLANQLSNINYIKSDLIDFLKDSDRKFSLIHVKDVLEHLDKDEVLEFLELANKSLDSEGQLLMQVPNANGFNVNKIYYSDFTHETLFSERSLDQILEYSNFKKVNYFPYRPIKYSLLSYFRYYAWLLFEIFLKATSSIELSSNVIVTLNLIAVAKKN
tara:strand:- start:42 stop:767 length:726 start_codon:yes stop_codon:yes gene_type:complete